MKYSIHFATILLLVMSAWTRGDTQGQLPSPKAPIRHLLQFYSEYNTNTAVLMSPPVLAALSSKTISFLFDKSMDLATAAKLVEAELKK